MRKLVTIYNEVKNDLPLFLRLYGRIKKERLSKPQIVELLETPNRLLDLKEKVELYNDHLWNLHSKKEQMEKELEEKKRCCSYLWLRMFNAKLLSALKLTLLLASFHNNIVLMLSFSVA
jgi:hypothetical protein